MQLGGSAPSLGRGNPRSPHPALPSSTPFALVHRITTRSSRSSRLTVSASSNGAGPPGGPKKVFGENLEDRIASGEFDDSGSTKEKLTRPLRKLLAKDSSGPGAPPARRPLQALRARCPCSYPYPHCVSLHVAPALLLE